MGNQTPAFIRTLTPYVVSFIVSQLATRNISVSPEDAATIGGFITVAGGYLYYVVVKLIERRKPSAGVLLGSTSQPTYKRTK